MVQTQPDLEAARSDLISILDEFIELDNLGSVGQNFEFGLHSDLNVIPSGPLSLAGLRRRILKKALQRAMVMLLQVMASIQNSWVK